MSAPNAPTAERPLHAPYVEPALFELGEHASVQADAVFALTNPKPWERTGQMVEGAARIQDLPQECEIQKQYIAGLGSLPVGQVVERPKNEPTKEQVHSISYDMDQAAQGNREPLTHNALLVLYEAILSEGVSHVKVRRNQRGELVQGEHKIEDILRKAIERNPGEHETLHQITMATGIDIYTWNALDKAGYFDNGDIWVVPRLVPVGVPAGPIRKYGYFENLAVSWTIIAKDKNVGDFDMYTLMTAGVEIDDAEEIVERAMTSAELDQMMEDRLLRRHDIQGVVGVYKKLGLPVPEQMIDFFRGFKVSRGQLKRPDVPYADLAEWYDDALGSAFFVGTRAPRQDYVAWGKKSIVAMHALEPLADTVVDEIMTYHGTVHDDMEKARLLARIGRKHVLDYVIDNPQVDARPLGLAAVAARDAYWQHKAAGDVAGAGNARNAFHRVSRANMCGMGDNTSGNTESKTDNDDAGEQTSSDELCLIESYGCWCCPYNDDGSKRSKPMKICAIDDGEKVSCQRSQCGAWIAKDGPGHQMSRIAEKGERRARESALQEKIAATAGKMTIATNNSKIKAKV